MKNGWEGWSLALSDAERANVFEKAAVNLEEEVAVGLANTQRTVLFFRTSSVRWSSAIVRTKIAGRLMQMINASNRTNFGIGFPAPYEIRCIKYGATNDANCDWYQDVWLGVIKTFARKLSVVVQLSNASAYDGGKFEFGGIQSPGPELAARGSLLIFPWFIQHRVVPASEGKRSSLVTWIEGPSWR